MKLPLSIWLSMAAALFLLAASMMVSAGSVQPPDRLTARVCAERLHVEGREVANARWGMQMSEVEALSLPFHDETPNWMRALITNWIKDAYAFKGEPSQWMAKILQECQSIAES